MGKKLKVGRRLNIGPYDNGVSLLWIALCLLKFDSLLKCVLQTAHLKGFFSNVNSNMFCHL